QFEALADCLAQRHEAAADGVALGVFIADQIAGGDKRLQVAVDAALGRAECARHFGYADGGLAASDIFEDLQCELDGLDAAAAQRFAHTRILTIACTPLPSTT